MSIWDEYPADYRQEEWSIIRRKICAGSSVLLIGLSGAGKSNLLGFIAHRQALPQGNWVWVDGNRLQQASAQGFWELLGGRLGCVGTLDAIENALSQRLADPGSRICLCLDRFDALPVSALPAVTGGLRALRDLFKYQLTCLAAVRKPLDPSSELAELFFGGQIWLGPLSEPDARWSARSFGRRMGVVWTPVQEAALLEWSGRYPAFLRGLCEAAVDSPVFERDILVHHPAVQHRLDEFWKDEPAPDDLRRSGLTENPLLQNTVSSFDSVRLTAKEALLYEALRAHPGTLVDKDTLIRAVWPEDRIYDQGVRDDSLAQLVRRLRTKVGETHILSVPGRGYQWVENLPR